RACCSGSRSAHAGQPSIMAVNQEPRFWARTSCFMSSIPSAPGRLSLPLWNERFAAPLAPTSAAEMRARGWDCVDVVFVTGDAYVDHPSFAMAILHRVLEAAGFRVAMLSQPDWRSVEPWRQFGRPRLFFAVRA